MNCICCKAVNDENSRYCNQCGAELGHALESTIMKRGLRDRNAIEIEMAESVASRLIKWGTILVVLLGIAFGKTWWDIREAAKTVKLELENAQHSMSDLEQRAKETRGKIDEAARTTDSVRAEANKQLASVMGLNARLRKLTDSVNESEATTQNVKNQIAVLATASNLTLPFIASVSHAGSQATIQGVNFGTEPGVVYLNVRNVSTNENLLPQLELKRDSISQWQDQQIVLRLPQRAISAVDYAKREAAAGANKPSSSSTFGVRFEYFVRTLGGKNSNVFSHSEFFVNVNEHLGISQ